MMRSAIRHHHRGGVLLEVVIALGLFIGAGVFALGAMGSAASSMSRSARETIALDLARSKLAELEAGLVSLSELREREGVLDRIGSMQFDDEEAGTLWRGREWIVIVETERTEFSGLTLVELTVRETEPFAGGGGAPATLDGWGGAEDELLIEATVRQLMRLREGRAESYEEDDILEGLPLGDEASRFGGGR